MYSHELSSTGVQLQDPFLVEGYRIVITQKSGYGGYYHDELDTSFSCFGSDYEFLINNIATQYFKKMQDNCGRFDDFEMGSYDIYNARFVVAGDDVFVDEYYEEECVTIEKTMLQVKYDIEHCPVYLALLATQ